LVDKPDKRKVHTQPIPRVGGIAVVIAYFSTFLLFAVPVTHTVLISIGGFPAVKALAAATVLIFLIGLADDIFTLEPWHKFSVEIIAALLVAAGGVRIHDIAGLPIHPAIGVLCTVLWLVACTNAINLIDGLDGLASGVALLATGTVLIASFVTGNLGLAIIAAPLVGALAGFLVFNSNPASIFLGDSGSLVIGFLLGSFSIMWSNDAKSALDMLAPLLALSVPLLDTTLSIIRRFLSRRPLFRPDRAHIHHRLLARGCTHRTAVLWLYVAAGIAGMLSLALLWAPKYWEVVVLVIFVGAAALGIRQLQYSEFEAARDVFGDDVVRREIGTRIAVQELERGLMEAETVTQCWTVIQGASHNFGLHASRMKLRSELFTSPHRSGTQDTWAMRISISEANWIEFPQGDLLGATGLVRFAETVRRVLVARLPFVSASEPAYQPTVYGSVSSALRLSMRTREQLLK
jgi:UDP-GlcNAc:undecaprenyl-phosphate GlcNAc-1-phosphate transferase